MNRIFHPLLALIASATDRELARYVEFLKTENQILRSRIKGQIHTRPHEREKLVSLHLNSAWVKQQTEMFLNETAGRTEKPAIVMHDRDTKFTQEFVSTLEARGVRSNALPKASPNLNGRCERVIQTIKLECLRKFLIFGQRHLDHILREFTEYYNRLRSHTERDHLPPIHSTPDEISMLDSKQIVVKPYVGGLVKSFERKAA